MRKLVILRGVMGSGKSTFIKSHNLEPYTLSSDNLRLLFSTFELGVDYKEHIPQFNNQKVWNLLFYLLEERMKKGEFTIIDAMHANFNEYSAIYKKLAEKYRYRVYIVDFSDVPKEELYKRNEIREEYRKVSTSTIDRVYKIIQKEVVPAGFKVIKPDEFTCYFKMTPRSLDEYSSIHIIGDIHGSYTALKTYFEDNPMNDKDYYIFCGDYFDRGVENYQTFKFLKELMLKQNTLFLIGNHEDKLYKYACDDEFKMDYGLCKTILEFIQNNVNKKEIRGFIKNLAQVAYIEFRGKTYLVTHGGIPYMPKKSLDFYSTNSLIYGIDKYDTDIDLCFNEYMMQEDEKIYQIHGHRNFYKYDMNAFEYSFNLDGDIEHGGSLRILTLNDKGYETLEIKNTVYNKSLDSDTAIFDLVQNLRSNKYVYEKDLGNNISSFNFTKEAFYHKKWDTFTTKARGLFIDVQNQKIVARSYNKFFSLEERDVEHLSYPVNFYLKYNGFLGIISVYNGELFVASKSTNTGVYVDYFKEIFYQQFSKAQIAALKEKLSSENLSAVFEVIDPVNDAHIIKYSKKQIVLLDLIKNTNEFVKLSYDELQAFALANNIMVKEIAYTVNDAKEFNEVYNKLTLDDYKYNNEFVEGFVIEDSANHMFKVKTAYYNKWKHLRNKMEYAITNNKYKTKSNDELEISFLNYLQEKYQGKEVDVNAINIVDERHDFYDIIYNRKEDN